MHLVSLTEEGHGLPGLRQPPLAAQEGRQGREETGEQATLSAGRWWLHGAGLGAGRSGRLCCL